MGSKELQHDIVVVGGGICGLSIALALHRKGISCLVLEKSDTLRAAGAAIGVHINGWRALDQLGVGVVLRRKAILLLEIQDKWLYKSRTSVICCRDREFRCLKRSDLIETLAQNLPLDSVRFGSEIIDVEMDPISSFPIIYIDDGSIIKAKVLIGCDGSNSVVAKSLGLGPPKLFPVCGVRGLTQYPKGHMCGDNFLRLRGDGIIFGRIPVNDKLVYWFIGLPCAPEAVEKDPKLIRIMTLGLLKDFPEDIVEMVKDCDLDSLSLTHTKYRDPWHLLFKSLWSGTTTVAGDAMHAMGPFLGQGGSAGLEDSIVLARCLARELHVGPLDEINDQDLRIRVEGALRAYVKERRLRILWLSMETYLMGWLIASSSWIRKITCLVILIAVFGGGSLGHTRYDCGHL